MSIRTVILFCQETLRREAWAALLEQQPGISTVISVGTVTELQSLAYSERTTTFVDLPEVDTAFISQLESAVPDTNLLILMKVCDMDQAVTFLQAGATGLIGSNAAVQELVQAINAVGRDEIVLPPDIASRVMLALARGEKRPKQTTEPLTGREQEVLSLLAEGLTNKDIAQSLFLSVRTIEAHLRNIYSKLEVSSRTEAVLWAVQHGYEP